MPGVYVMLKTFTFIILIALVGLLVSQVLHVIFVSGRFCYLSQCLAALFVSGALFSVGIDQKNKSNGDL